MATCNHCRANLSDADVQSGKCPACGKDVKPGTSDSADIKRLAASVLFDSAPIDDSTPLPPSGSGSHGSGSHGSRDVTPIDQTMKSDEIKPLEIDKTMVSEELVASEDVNRTVSMEEPVAGSGAGEIDRTMVAEELGGGPRGGADIDKTFVSDEHHPADIDKTFVSDEHHPVEADKTFVSDEGAGGDDSFLNTVKTMWMESPSESNPNMTIKTDEGDINSTRSTLVIKSKKMSKPQTASSSLAEAARKAAAADQPEYELTKVLGEGGMGIVYEGRQTSIDREVAVKMLKPNTALDEKTRMKFLAEAVVTGDLDHPNIVPIYDVGTNEDGALFYSMKKVQGTPWLKVVKTKTLHENLDILMKVSDAVAFAHARGIVHRDLKPENVMLGDYGEVLVMDWGLAQATSTFRKSNNVGESTSMGGTPSYMAPEMATGPIGKIGPHSDIYLLGAILYEIITGRPPHTGKNAMQCLMAAAKNDIVPTDKTGELVDVARKAMATKSEDRYSTVQTFQQAVREYLAHEESIVLSTRAAGDLVEAQKSDDYQRFAKALFGFQEAFTFWEGNTKAQAGMSEVKLAYAGSALRKGDYDLGASLLEPSNVAHQSLRQQIVAAQNEREARQGRLKVMKRAAVGLLATVLIGGTVAFFWIRAEADKARKAEAVASQEKDKALEAKAEADKRREEAEAAQKQELIAKQDAIKQKEKAVEEEQKATIAKVAAETAQKAAEEARMIAVAEQKKAEEAKRAEEYEAYVARIGLAAAKIDENAFGNALELLNGCKPELQHWEWGRLMHLCSQGSKAYPAGAPVDAVAISGDGKKFVTGSWDGKARVWSVDNLKAPLQTLNHNGLYIHTVAFSPDGKHVATGSNDGSGATGFAKLFNAETGEFIRSFDGHTDDVLSVAFSRDGKRLLTGSYDKTARLWNVADGKQIGEPLLGHNWWVWSAAFSADEKRIVTGSQDGTAIVWTTETGEHGPPFTGHQGPIYSAAFSPDGQWVATGGYDKRVLLWKPSDVQPYDFGKIAAGAAIEPPKFRELAGHNAGVRSVEFSRDGKLLISGSHDNTVKVWDAETGKSFKTFRGHDSWVRSVAFSNDGKWVLSGSHDNNARVWSIEGYEEIRVLEGKILQSHVDAVLAASFSPDGSSIVTASRDRTAKTWDFATGREKQTFEEGHGFLASTAVFFPDGKKLLTAAVDNTVRVWDVSTGTQIHRLEHTGRSAALALSRDAKWILTGSDNKSVKLWDAEKGELVREFTGHNSEVSAVAMSPDGRTILSGDATGKVMVWNAMTGERLHRIDVHTSKVAAALFLPDGKRALTASGDRTVAQWDMETGKELVPLVLKHPSPVISMALLPNGKELLTSCDDRTVRIWNLDKAEVVGKFEIKTGVVNNVAISPDGKKALTANPEERSVRLWDIENRRELLFPVGNDQLAAFYDPKYRTGLIWSAAFSPDGANVVTVGGSEARLWDTDSARERMAFSPHGVVASASFSPDGKRIVTGSWDNSARIWNAATGQGELKLERGHTAYVNSAVFSPDGKLVLTASDDRTAKLWDATTGEVKLSLDGHTDRVRAGVFSKDGKQIMTSSSDSTAKLWDAATGKLIRTFAGHKFAVLCVALSQDGKFAVTGGEDNTAVVWNVETGENIRTLQGHTASVASVAISPDGRRILTGSQDITSKLWDAQTGKEILTLKGHSQEVTTVAFSTSGKQALTGSRDGTAIVWLAVNWGEAKPAVAAVQNRLTP